MPAEEPVLILMNALHTDMQALIRQLLKRLVIPARQPMQYDLGQERPVQHLVAVEQVPVEYEF